MIGFGFGMDAARSGGAPAEASPVTDIALADVPDGFLFQRDIGETYKTLTVAGTYSGSAPTSVEVNIKLNSDDSDHVAWTAFDDFSAAGGAWSGIVQVPQSPADDALYIAGVRDAENHDRADTGENLFHVGIVLIGYGQSGWGSHMSAAASPPSAATGTFYWNGSVWTSVPAANGVRNLLNDLVGALGIPVGIVSSAQAGMGSSFLIPGGGWPTPNGVYEALEANVIAASGAEFLVVHHGEGNADAEPPETWRWQSDWETIRDTLAAAIGREPEDLPLIVSSLSPLNVGYDLSTDSAWVGQNAAIVGIEGEVPAAYYSHSNMDAALDGTSHMTGTHCGKSGKRYAHTILNMLGETGYENRPLFWIDEVERIDETTLKVTLTHSLGDDFTPTSGITGFSLSADGFANELSISAVDQDDANTILITHESVDAGLDLQVRYQYGKTPDISEHVQDNSTLAVPLNFLFGTHTAIGLEEEAPPVPTYLNSTMLTPAGGSTSFGTSNTTFNLGSPSSEDRMVIVGVVTRSITNIPATVKIIRSGESDLTGTLVEGEGSSGGYAHSVSLWQFSGANALPAGAQQFGVALTYATGVWSFVDIFVDTVPEDNLTSTTKVSSAKLSTPGVTNHSLDISTDADGFAVVLSGLFSGSAVGSNTGAVSGDESYSSHDRRTYDSITVNGSASGTIGATGDSTVTVTYTTTGALSTVAASWR